MARAGKETNLLDQAFPAGTLNSLTFDPSKMKKKDTEEGF
jgi:hypothetical protein